MGAEEYSAPAAIQVWSCAAGTLPLSSALRISPTSIMPQALFLIILTIFSLASRAPAAEQAALQRGKASWYHESQRTASGGRFDPNGLTAAHRTLPFGTLVRVTNLRSQRCTVVRINDRGPYKKGRIIDVSRAAARELEMIHSGTATVTVEVVAAGKG